MHLQAKRIVVTGAGSGLGRAVALELARCGARLALLDLSAERLGETERLCRAAGTEARPYVADVSDEPRVERALGLIDAELGGVDGLVNNAGMTRDALLVKARDGKVEKKMSLAAWQTVIDVDLKGVFLCAREAAVRMIERGLHGAIVNVSSISRAGNVGQTNYAAAKAGVVAMTVTWAKELARHGIRVAALAPGFSDTPMVAAMSEPARARVVSSIPLRRLARPEEIAHSVRYILENDYFTGRVLEVDGGLRL
jgi:3-oxoacyl-[acyl-carrier protein] reductase